MYIRLLIKYKLYSRVGLSYYSFIGTGGSIISHICIFIKKNQMCSKLKINDFLQKKNVNRSPYRGRNSWETYLIAPKLSETLKCILKKSYLGL